MKNHYKIHAQNFDDFDHEKEEDTTIPSGKDAKRKVKDSILNPTQTPAANGACKTEMLDWLRSDFDQVNIHTATAAAKPTTNSEEDWVHLD